MKSVKQDMTCHKADAHTAHAQLLCISFYLGVFVVLLRCLKMAVGSGACTVSSDGGLVSILDGVWRRFSAGTLQLSDYNINQQVSVMIVS